MSSKRELLLRVSAATWGTATAIALLPLVTRPAPPGQLPGFATSINIDASAPMRFVAALVLLPIIFPALLQPLIRRLAGGRRWAVIAASSAMIAALWQAIVDPNVAWTIVPAAIAVAICFLLRDVDAWFTRRDVILIPTTLTVLLAIIDIAHSLPVNRQFVMASMIVLAVRLAIVFVPGRLDLALAFTFAPLGIIFETEFFSADQRHFGWPALLIAVFAPFATRPVMRNARRAIALCAWLIYPLWVYGYTTSTNLLAAEGKPRANFFEDAHGLVPASEMLRGERLYRDILPAHGLIEDGLLDYVAMRMRGPTAGAALKTRVVVGALTSIGIYALGAAATGAPEAGVLSYCFGVLFGIIPATVRAVPALFTLAAIAAALRLRRAPLLMIAGAGAAVSILASLDFGAYTALALFIAVLRFTSDRLRAARLAAAGFAAAAVPVLIVFGLFGIAGDFVRQTWFELRAFGPPAVLTPFTPPPIFKTLRFFPEALGGVFDKNAALMIFWIAATIFAGVTLTMRPARRIAPFVIIAFWIAVAGTSYAARHHLHFQIAVAPMLVGAAWVLHRSGSRFAPVLAALLFIISNFTAHLLVLSSVRQSRGPFNADLVEIGDVPRAHGAFFARDDAATVANAKLFVDQNLRPDDTFFDFTNRPMLYFLLARDCPIRDLGPAWYEPQSRQREVIAAIERNPHVRAALIDGNMGLDGVPNEVRAPLVWEYLQQHFEPRFTSGKLVFWMRK